MTLKELKDYLNGLPQEMDEFSVVNGEYGYLDENDKQFIYRLDKPVLVCLVEENSNEIVLLHQTREDLTGIGEYDDLPIGSE